MPHARFWRYMSRLARLDAGAALEMKRVADTSHAIRAATAT